MNLVNAAQVWGNAHRDNGRHKNICILSSNILQKISLTFTISLYS